MTREARAAAIVPVRIGSQRLPGKALLRESGQALFLYTCQAAARAELLASVHVATDDQRVAEVAEAAGFPVLRTSSRPRTGSERCAEAAAAIDAEVFLDIQGDWPEVDPGDLDRLAEQLLEGKARCNTLAAPLDDEEAAADPNVVKVVRGRDGTALYFSRAAVPFLRSPAPGRRLRHVGVYGFDRQTLLSIPALPSSGLAETEGLEQLRFLENHIPMHVLDARGDPWGIETRADYDAFLRRVTSKA